ncbi:hypothetical protein K449DRAFT_75438 [Hypoxylon sp. EC38]|nr:hypothetical protein K449DRAFT_75438 [Hypoxylon sp. EC38]
MGYFSLESTKTLMLPVPSPSRVTSFCTATCPPNLGLAILISFCFFCWASRRVKILSCTFYLFDIHTAGASPLMSAHYA